MVGMWSNNDFPYLYDTHVHTKQSSACGTCTGADMVRAYKKAGYAGIMITDHFFYGNTAVDRSLPWSDWVETFYLGYADAKTEGDRIGFQVFWGWESGYHGTEFLIFGLNKEWLLTHPEIKDASIEEQYRLVHEDNGIVIHAHPYREEPYIDEICLYPEHVDAVEAINACHANPISTHHYEPLFDLKAKNYARAHHFPITAGSDAHFDDLLGGGMAFREKLKDIDDFIQAVYTKRDCLLTDGHNSCMNYTIE